MDGKMIGIRSLASRVPATGSKAGTALMSSVYQIKPTPKCSSSVGVTV